MPRSIIALAVAASLLALTWLVAITVCGGAGSVPTVSDDPRESRSGVAVGRLPEGDVASRSPSGAHPPASSTPSSVAAAPATLRSDEARRPRDGDTEIAALRARILELERRVENLRRGPSTCALGHLASSDPTLRRRAVWALRTLASRDAEALRAVRRALEDEDASVRVEAIEVLADLEDRSAIPEIRGLLEDADESVRLEAIDGLVELDAKEAGGSIARLLLDPDEGVRADAARALGALRPEEGTHLLIGALGDVDPDVRREAIDALGKLRATEALPALRQLCASGMDEPSFRLLEVVRDLGDARPYEARIARLSRAALHAPDASTRKDAIEALARRADEKSVEVFRQALADASPRVRREARSALEK